MHLKREGEEHQIQFKSRLVERGDQETTQGIRTDSPTADLEAVNLVISWASSMKFRVATFDITNAYFHGEPEGRMCVGNCPIYGG